MIVAGFGCRESATLSSLREALLAAEDLHGLSAYRFATLRAKADYVRPLGSTLIEVSPEAAQAQVTLTQSAASLKAWGVGSVAEATALAAAGRNARLLGPRVISEDGLATCALAEGEPI